MNTESAFDVTLSHAGAAVTNIEGSAEGDTPEAENVASVGEPTVEANEIPVPIDAGACERRQHAACKPICING